MDHHTEHHHAVTGESELTTSVSYEDGVITIELKDNEGNVPELGISHEKEMHLIIIRADLQEYYHGHPEKHGGGIYTLRKELSDNEYKVFVDIAPKNLSYAVSPINLHVGHAHQLGHTSNDLAVDQERTQTVDGRSVEINATTFEAGQVIILQFDTKGEVPEPYLGALDHVVILDENAEKFIHVHPASDNETQFDAVITEAGKYKLWAEFQFNGKVSVYSYVIEVK
ncbi:hypothetical protein [Sporosarcina sp. P33]|uniref:hypothetical protein n=1 Tax=Sporosarcina sp. P33 TaxID=1930764 RepID=UPI0009BF2E5B|nr:hypothetical protein [Sporosarcina sp. P33]ARD47534.1 hypothetical protein SporoP33_04310 [Sporosarcina sp. P33]